MSDARGKMLWLVAGIAGALLAAAAPLGAQLSPAGIYQAQSSTLELTLERQVRLSTAGGSQRFGSYRVARDTIAFQDDAGQAACSGAVGLYLWRLDEGELRLQVVNDPCEARRTTLLSGWLRASSAPGAAVQALDAIIVSAEREQKDIQRTPVSITVLSTTDVREAGVTRPQDLTYLVPGLQVGSLVGGNALTYLRGVGNFAGNSLQDATMTFNFDGVYIARPTSTGGLFYDLERVEVLKGPQGTLYGRNATGGAVNLLPRRPVRGAFTGEIASEYGAHGTLHVDGALNLPLGARAALRLAGQRARHDGYMNDGTDDQDDWAGRLSVRVDVNDRLSVRLVADHYDQKGHGPGSTPLALGVANRWGVTSTEGGTYYASQRMTIAGRNWAPLPRAQHADNRHSGVGATVDWRTSLGVLTVVSGYRRSRLDATGSPSGNFVTVQEVSRQASVEARIASVPHPRVQTLAGLFLFDESIQTPAGELFRPWNQFNFSLQTPQSGVTSTAAFGRVTWHVTDRWRATLGARYTHERKPFSGSFESFSRICPPLPTGSCPDAQPFPEGITTPPLTFPEGASVATPVFNPADGSLTVGFRILADTAASFSRPTWRAAVEHDLTADIFLYASHETGFKSGGFFFSSDAKVYQPEELRASTLGVRSRLLANRFQVNLELFDWRYRDQQVSKLSVDSRGVTNLRTENIGHATIRGAEADLEALLTPTTWVAGRLQYLRAIYDKYAYVTPLSSGPPLSGCPVTPTQAGFAVDCSGRQSPYAPEWTVTFEAEHGLPLRRAGGIVASTRARFQSATLMGLDFLPQQQQEAYWTLDASLGYHGADNRYTVTLFGRNLTDATVLSNTFVVPFSAIAVGVLRPPRTIGVRVSAGFGSPVAR